MSRIVITGGPGAGKTTLLLALQARRYTIVADSPRTIIQDRRRRGLSPRPNACPFCESSDATAAAMFWRVGRWWAPALLHAAELNARWS
jgi:predicted ATPase